MIDLQYKQNLPLDEKVLLSRARIHEYYRYLGGNVFVSFSGGKDSTVLLHLKEGLNSPQIKQKTKEFTMTNKNSKTHLQSQSQDWKQNYKAWLNELKNLRTKKKGLIAPKSLPNTALNKKLRDYTIIAQKIPKREPVSKVGNSFSNFYDDGMTTNRNHLSEEELKLLI